MWKNGKEGNTEGRRIMEGKDGRRETIEAEEKTGKRGTQRGDESWKEKTGDGRRLKRKKKRSQGKEGDAAGEGRGAAGTLSGKQSGRKQNNCGMA